MIRWFGLAALLAALVPPDVPVIPVQVERVEVDVRVVDREGQPLAHLTAADFAVEIDGRPARVESATFQADEIIHRPASTTQEAPGRTLVFLVHLDVARANLPVVLTALRETTRLVEGLTSADRAAVLVFDSRLRLKQDFSSERDRLRRVLTRDALLGPDLPWEGAEKETLASLLTEARARQAGSPASALQALADALRQLPGPKSLLFFSAGFGETSFQSPQWGSTPSAGAASASGGDGSTTALRELGADRVPGLPATDLGRVLHGQAGAELQRAVLSLNAARAAVISLDVAPTPERSQHQGTLEALADNTGGMYAKTYTFPAAALQAARRVLSGRYLLSCEKPDLPAGEHAIRVRLTSKRGASVLARRTFSDP
jgi:VWFA-related protein